MYFIHGPLNAFDMDREGRPSESMLGFQARHPRQSGRSALPDDRPLTSEPLVTSTKKASNPPPATLGRSGKAKCASPAA